MQLTIIFQGIQKNYYLRLFSIPTFLFAKKKHVEEDSKNSVIIITVTVKINEIVSKQKKGYNIDEQREIKREWERKGKKLGENTVFLCHFSETYYFFHLFHIYMNK